MAAGFRQIAVKHEASCRDRWFDLDCIEVVAACATRSANSQMTLLVRSSESLSRYRAVRRAGDRFGVVTNMFSCSVVRLSK